jgi:hypothetical protein
MVNVIRVILFIYKGTVAKEGWVIFMFESRGRSIYTEYSQVVMLDVEI